MDAPRPTGAELDDLVRMARYGRSDERATARVAILQAAERNRVTLRSTRPLYAAFARGELIRLTIPALNIRGFAYEFLRAIFRAALAERAGAFIIEIARSEMGYTGLRPADLVLVAQAAAVREGFTGPLFLQGDHYKVDPVKGVEAEVQSIERLIDESLAAGFLSLDLDASATVDLTQPQSIHQQAQNAEITAQLTAYVRRRASQPVAVGGEIGEIGGRVSTVEDLTAFMDGYRNRLGSADGIAKVAIQTGTSHGGSVRSDGSLEPMAVDFGAIRKLTSIARDRYGLAGVVQHGASTLPEASLTDFPAAGAVEIHLSTEFQNLIFDHPDFPNELRVEMRAALSREFGQYRRTDETEAQFVYRHRKRLWAMYQEPIDTLPVTIRATIASTLEAKVRRILRLVGAAGTAPVVERLIAPS